MDPSVSATLRSLGLDLPTPAYIVGTLVFGLIGLVAYRHGKRLGRPRTRWAGVALMLFPYAVPQTWALYLVGALICAFVAFDQR